MKLVKVLFAIIIALVIGNVTLTNRNVDESVIVADLTKQISTLQKQNTILSAQVANLGSLSQVSTQIAALGFTDTPKLASLQSPASVALR